MELIFDSSNEKTIILSGMEYYIVIAIIVTIIYLFITRMKEKKEENFEDRDN